MPLVSDKKLKLVSIAELFGLREATCINCGTSETMNRHFSIPAYQRGYRWTEIQVESLLTDLLDFHEQTVDDANAWYSLQPLVVAKQIESDPWNVVDGQQRLTTLYIILRTYGFHEEQMNGFKITYDTRECSRSFLQNLGLNNNTEEDVDLHFMNKAYETIKKWQLSHNANLTSGFLATISTKCKLIWYEVDPTDAEKAFERLNTGKIPLTSSELIRALYMVADNGISEQEKMEIAKEWEFIENDLRDDRFWYMLNSKESPSATRIDFLFDLVANIEFRPEDQYQTFRKFEELSRQKGALLKKWNECRDLFWQFQGWYNDLECYHYVGVLRLGSLSVTDLIALKRSDKPLPETLAAKLIEKLKLQDGFSENEKVQFHYDTSAKELRLLFVLFNIETLNIRHREQKKHVNNQADDASRYLGYERFPFDLYHLQNWDIEHVSSQTDNQLTTRADQKEWLNAAISDIKDDSSSTDAPSNLWHRVETFLERPDSQPEHPANTFSDLSTEIKKLAGEAEGAVAGSHALGNLTLLDCGTNRSYQNALFPTKRRKIIEGDRNGVFIPICTKQLFLKYYTKSSTKISRWDEAIDGANYFQAIADVMNALYQRAGLTDLPDLLKRNLEEKA